MHSRNPKTNLLAVDEMSVELFQFETFDFLLNESVEVQRRC